MDTEWETLKHKNVGGIVLKFGTGKIKERFKLQAN